MPISFNFFKINRLPSGKKIETTEQLTLFNDAEENMEVCKTGMSLENKNFLPNISRYHASHDFLIKLRYPGRARGKTFQEYITPYHFSVFTPRDEGADSQSLIVATKGKVAVDFVKRLNNKIEVFDVEERRIDFDKLRPLVGHVKGAWFGKMNAANISATGIFGPHVDQSDEFKHAENIGKLNAIMGYYPMDKVAYTTTITRTGGVVLFDAFDTEEDSLKLVEHMRVNLLESCWGVLPAKRGGRRKD